MSIEPSIRAFFDPATGTVSYVVADPGSRRAAIIDPVLDIDLRSGRIRTDSAQHIQAWLAEQKLTVDWILETHAHADHLSAAAHLQRTVGGRIGIGEHITRVQCSFETLFNFGPGFAADPSAFDHLLHDGEHLRIGALDVTALLVPGHTPADLAFRVADAVFVGDTLFMPDVGTARADFPGGDARQLFRSIHHILSLPPSTRLFVCHDYPPAGRAPAWQTTVAAQRAANIHVRDGISESDFVALREARDATLGTPNLMLASLQVNLRAGRLPPAEANGIVYLKIPLNALPDNSAR